MKISMRTILTNLVDETIKEWKTRMPDKALEDYQNWRVDIINKIDYRLTKQNISLDEIIIDTTESDQQK